MGCSATNQGLIVQKIIAEGKSKLFFRSIIVKNPEFFDGAGAGVGAGAENGIIFRLRLQQKSTAPGGSGSATLHKISFWYLYSEYRYDRSIMDNNCNTVFHKSFEIVYICVVYICI